MATFFNLVGALAGVSVATTIGKELVDTHFVGIDTILSALLAYWIQRGLMLLWPCQP